MILNIRNQSMCFVWLICSQSKFCKFSVIWGPWRHGNVIIECFCAHRVSCSLCVLITCGSMDLWMRNVCLIICRAVEELSQSPNRVENNSSSSLTLSASTSSPRAAPVLLPGLDNIQVRPYVLSLSSACLLSTPHTATSINTLLFAISRICRPPAALSVSTAHWFWTLHCCHHWPHQPGLDPLTSSPQSQQPYPRTCQRLHPRPFSFSVLWCPA